MTLDPQQLLIGPVRVSYGGRDLGFTTEDGVRYAPSYDTAKFKGAQASVNVHKHRTGIEIMVSANIAQMSLENWQLLEDLKDAPDGNTLEGAYNVRPTERALVVTGPSPNGGTRTMLSTASVSAMGEIQMSNNAYQNFPVEWELLGDAETNKLWRVVDSPTSAAVPTPTSYATVIGETEAALADAATAVNVAATLQVNFPVAIRPDQLSANKFMLKTSDGNTFVEATYGYGATGGVTDYTKVRIIPTANMAAATPHQLIVAPGVLSQDGVAGTGASIQFTTA